MINLALTGYTGAGKSSAVKALSSLLPGCVTVSISEIIRKEMETVGIPQSSEAMRRYSVRQIAQHGPLYWPNKAIAVGGEWGEQYCLIDGLRTSRVLAPAYRRRHRLVVLGLEAPLWLRFYRAARRNGILHPRNRAELDLLWALMRDEMIEQPNRFDIGHCLKHADWRIDTTDLQAVQPALKQVAAELTARYSGP